MPQHLYSSSDIHNYRENSILSNQNDFCCAMHGKINIAYGHPNFDREKLLNIIVDCRTGSYVFTIYDNFSGNIPLLVIALFQCLGISYVYGLNRYHLYKVLISVVCLSVLVCLIITFAPLDRFASNFDWETQERYGNVL